MCVCVANACLCVACVSQQTIINECPCLWILISICVCMCVTVCVSLLAVLNWGREDRQCKRKKGIFWGLHSSWYAVLSQRIVWFVKTRKTKSEKRTRCFQYYWFWPFYTILRGICNTEKGSLYINPSKWPSQWQRNPFFLLCLWEVVYQLWKWTVAIFTVKSTIRYWLWTCWV